MMMVRLSAEPVYGFTVFAPKQIYGLLFHQSLQGSVDRGQADLSTASLHRLIKFLCTRKTSDTF